MNEYVSNPVSIKFGENSPHRPQKYIFPNPITRDNFASTLITSFRVSGADVSRHILYFELLKAHTGFDYETNVQNFLQSGGWNTFSQEEQQLFMQSFDSVTRHHTKNGGQILQKFHNEPEVTLNTQLSPLIKIPNEEYPSMTQRIVSSFEMNYGSLLSLNQQEFLSHLNERYPLR